jgi:hypothetical protein
MHEFDDNGSQRGLRLHLGLPLSSFRSHETTTTIAKLRFDNWAGGRG